MNFYAWEKPTAQQDQRTSQKEGQKKQRCEGEI